MLYTIRNWLLHIFSIDSNNEDLKRRGYLVMITSIVTMLSQILAHLAPIRLSTLNASTELVFGIIGQGISIYLSRIGRVTLAAWIAALVAGAGVYIVLLNSKDTIIILPQAVIPLVLGSIVLRPKSFFVFLLLNLICTYILLTMRPLITSTITPRSAIAGYIGIMHFVFIFGILGSFITERSFRSLDKAKKDITVVAQELEILNVSLEKQVIERTQDLSAAKQDAETARAIAEEANSLKSSFLANMSHELRTPLNAIINYTYFLSNPTDGDNPEDQHVYLERVRANADHLLGLINDILDLSKIEAGHMVLAPEPVVLPTLIQSVAVTAQNLLKDKLVELVLDVAPDLPLIMVDKTRIRQVLLNLLSNAAKFTEQGTITIQAMQHMDTLEIAVSDTGVGIPLEAQERVFAAFQQVDHTLNRIYAGTGLGLPISRRLVELHGGILTLESIVGVGSTFTIRLPLTSVPEVSE